MLLLGAAWTGDGLCRPCSLCKIGCGVLERELVLAMSPSAPETRAISIVPSRVGWPAGMRLSRCAALHANAALHPPSDSLLRSIGITLQRFAPSVLSRTYRQADAGQTSTPGGSSTRVEVLPQSALQRPFSAAPACVPGELCWDAVAGVSRGPEWTFLQPRLLAAPSSSRPTVTSWGAGRSHRKATLLAPSNRHLL